MAFQREEDPLKSFEVLAGEPRYEPNPGEPDLDRSGLDRPRLGKIFFEISNGRASQACCIEVNQPDEALALAFFHKNWPVIGKMAREALLAGEIENGEIRLVAPI
jgi:hypothetical protein